jgi:hypothetical protein
MRWMITLTCDFACYLLAPLPFVLLKVFIAGIGVWFLAFV